jgi:hypothetical protein
MRQIAWASKQVGDRDDSYLRVVAHLLRLINCISHNQFPDGRVLQPLQSGRQQHPVGYRVVNFGPRTCFDQGIGAGKDTASGDHIVDHDRDLSFDVAYDVRDLRPAEVGPPFVHDDQRQL